MYIYLFIYIHAHTYMYMSSFLQLFIKITSILPRFSG